MMMMVLIQDSDLINVDGGQIEIKAQSKLVLNTHDAFADLGSFKSRAFKLMKYGTAGRSTGTFGGVEFIGVEPKHVIRYNYLGEYIALLAEGHATSSPKFGALKLCFNQTEVANTLDYFNVAYGGVPGMMPGLSGDVQKLGDELQNFVDKLDDGDESTPVGPGAKNIPELKEIFFDLSGYFISNVIISRAYDEAKRDVYNRVYNYKEYEEPTKGIWGQVKGAMIDTDKDVESPHKFKVTNTGILVGFDMMTSSEVTCGVYAKQNKSSINQGNDLHKGEVKSYGLGLYGGIVKEKYDIKGLVSVSGDNYETTRGLRFNSSKAKGEFSGISGILDIEAGYRIGITSSSALGKIKLRPYAGGESSIGTDKRV
jgi:hypothetical protein